MIPQKIIVMKEIMQKYNIRAPRYTSYPPATEFTGEGFDKEKCRRILSDSNNSDPENISLYIHFPYCPQRCLFCGCNSYLEKSEEKSIEYIDALLKEIDIVLSQVDLSRPVTQIHWGGGTPNSLNFTQIGRIMDALHRRVSLGEHAEIAMECNPAYLQPDHLKQLKLMGFNRLSLGIQDFDPRVLKAVNREPSALPVNELMEIIRSLGFDGVNFDFIYGLPLQTREGFLDSLDKAIAMRPERLVTFSYAHVPWVQEDQKKLEILKIPQASEKLDMFLAGMEKMTSSGYKMIGMDHYALPEDILGAASENGQLHRNFQGYCTKETTGQVYAFGASAISQLSNAYLQNEKHPETYIKAINENSHAVCRGYELKEDEIIVRAAITELMCNGLLDFNALSSEYDKPLSEILEVFDYEPRNFSDLEKDKLLVAGDDKLELTLTGKLLSRVVSMRLDPKVKGESKIFSRTI